MQTFDFCDLTKGKGTVIVDVMNSLCIDMSKFGLQEQDRFKLNTNLVDFIRFCNDKEIPVVAFVKKDDSYNYVDVLNLIVNSQYNMEFEIVIASDFLNIEGVVEYIDTAIGYESKELLMVSDCDAYRERAEQEFGVLSVSSNTIAIAELDNLPFK